jgi:hypothetical protein
MNKSIAHCPFSIREVTSVAMMADETTAVTDVSEMSQKLMISCEGAMAITSDVSSTVHRKCGSRLGSRHVRGRLLPT